MKLIASLNLPAHSDSVSIVTSFVEKAALAGGLPEAESLSLTLASEEVFSYLCRVIPDDLLEIRYSRGSYYGQVAFRFPSHKIDWRAFNLTTKVSWEDEASLEELGLLIASRSTDRLLIREEKGKIVNLTLTKEKSYPTPAMEPLDRGRPLPEFSIQVPCNEELKFFFRRVNACYSVQEIPNALRMPGRLVDLAAEDEYQVLMAMGPGGQIGGGIAWHWMGTKNVECFGPYLLDQSPDSPMAAALLDACLGAIGRTPAVCLINRYPTRDLPVSYFESLGSLTLFSREGPSHPIQAYFRQMQEDPGSSVWSHPDLEPFLRREFRRLVLPREILVVRDQGEERNPSSVLAVEFDRPQGQAILRPVWSGADIAENLSNHLRLLRREGWLNLVFIMDLAQSWQADFTPALLKNGLSPRLIVPYGGEGDLVLFQAGEVLT